MNPAELMRSRVEWRRREGDPKIPGGEQYAAPVEVRARVAAKRLRIDGDKVALRVIWVSPEHDVQPGDLLDGAEVLSVDDGENEAGTPLVRFCHV